ncbi:MAG TPA: amidophosphoribosyltransferase [Candidatus Bathyarchaeota archaeon]|nr:amidophosphoribosyltransferase [Candidatus Bathyarchaeota archaeon]
MNETRELCGVCGYCLTQNEDVSPLIYNSLLAMQHRGQESAGISTIHNGKIYLHRGMGLVSQVFNEKILRSMKGNIGVGHVRYSTAGKSSLQDAQPYLAKYPKRGIVLAFNGNVVNNLKLRKKLYKDGVYLETSSDSETLTLLLSDLIHQEKSWDHPVYSLMTLVEGAYSVILLTGENELVAFRDPYGFRPLSYSVGDNVTAVSSESVGLNINGLMDVKELPPGSLLVCNNEGCEVKRILDSKRRAYCMFEYVYFSRPDSILCGRYVYDVRVRLGMELAKTYDTGSADVIVPVPDTSRPAAEGISQISGIPVAEGLIKNRYVGRTFIMPDMERRRNAVEMKLNSIRSVLEGREVIVVDDSIVRGITSKRIVDIVRRAGARKVRFWVTCPPIRSPCFYGIDMSTHRELIAFNKSIEEIQKSIGADELRYQTIEGLVKAIGLRCDELCLACLTGQYPTPLAQQIADKYKNLKPGSRYTELTPIR